MARWELPDGTVLIGVHSEASCTGDACVLHAPTDHHMRLWGLTWRNDRGLFERLCPHGIGHPDPDQFDHWKLNRNYDAARVHGCDGCCIPPAEGDT